MKTYSKFFGKGRFLVLGGLVAIGFIMCLCTEERSSPRPAKPKTEKRQPDPSASADMAQPKPTTAQKKPDAVPEKAPAKPAPDIEYKAVPCTGGPCQAWYIFDGVERVGVIINSATEPEVKEPVYALSLDDFMLYQRLQKEIFKEEYASLDDDAMLKKIAREWKTTPDRLREINILGSAMEMAFGSDEKFRRRKIVDLRE